MFVTKAMNVFISLYEEKSLKSAAFRLSLTVPPLTRMLKLTEEWIGDKLFIIERNKIIPTPVADELYKNLLPMYSYLSSYNKLDNFYFNVFTAYPNNSLISELFFGGNHLIPPEECIINYRTNIKNSDDLFISFTPLSSPNNFELKKIHYTLDIYHHKNHLSNKSDLPIYYEEPFDDFKDFNVLMEFLRASGYNGKAISSNNHIFMNNLLTQGKCIIVGLKPKTTNPFSFIDYNLQATIYCYINFRVKNTIKWGATPQYQVFSATEIMPD